MPGRGALQQVHHFATEGNAPVAFDEDENMAIESEADQRQLLCSNQMNRFGQQQAVATTG